VHLKIVNTQKFICHCGKECVSKGMLFHHKSRYHENKVYTCSYCGKVYASYSAFSGHLAQYHKPKICCPECGKMFAAGKSLRQHVEKHRKGAFIKCKICERMFSTYGGMTYHMESHDLPKIYECKENGCTNRFYALPENLKRHQSRSHFLKRLNCKVSGCTHTSSRKDYLARHYKAHKDISEKLKNSLINEMKGRRRGDDFISN